jgi:hypothetical protein
MVVHMLAYKCSVSLSSLALQSPQSFHIPNGADPVRRAEKGLLAASAQLLPFHRQLHAFSSGLGFGLVRHILIFLLSIANNIT